MNWPQIIYKEIMAAMVEMAAFPIFLFQSIGPSSSGSTRRNPNVFDLDLNFELRGFAIMFYKSLVSLDFPYQVEGSSKLC